MSVKLMTTEQIHTNLATIHNMWAGGVPPEQTDQVNALKAELKRRGVDANAVSPALPQLKMQVPEGMTLEQLQKEMSTISEAISKNPHDDALQERFANVRFELRKRTKSAPVVQAANPATSETLMQEAAKPTNGHSSFADGAVERRTTEMPRQVDIAAQAAVQLQRMQDMEQLMRKHNLAKIAAESASTILSMHADLNGDDIENACTIGLQVAEKIFEKVGL